MSPPYKLQPPIPGSIGGAAVGVTPAGVLVYLNCDVDGNLIASSSPPTPVTPVPFIYFSTVQQLIVAGPAELLSISCSNSGTETKYLQLYDTTSELATPVLEFFVVGGAQSLVGSDFLNDFPFTAGILAAVSTTSGTYVAADPEEHNIQGTYSA